MTQIKWAKNFRLPKDVQKRASMEKRILAPDEVLSTFHGVGIFNFLEDSLYIGYFDSPSCLGKPLSILVGQVRRNF